MEEIGALPPTPEPVETMPGPFNDHEETVEQLKVPQPQSETPTVDESCGT